MTLRTEKFKHAVSTDIQEEVISLTGKTTEKRTKIGIVIEKETTEAILTVMLGTKPIMDFYTGLRDLPYERRIDILETIEDGDEISILMENTTNGQTPSISGYLYYDAE